MNRDDLDHLLDILGTEFEQALKAFIHYVSVDGDEADESAARALNTAGTVAAILTELRARLAASMGAS